MPLSRRGWYLSALVSGAMALLVAFWSYLNEEPREPGLGPVVAYVFLPAAVYVSGALSLGRHKRMLLLTVALLDVESAALGFGLLVVMPFVVLIPLIGLAVAARLTGPRELWIPYLCAWAAGSAGVTIAVVRTVNEPNYALLLIVPVFAAADAGGIWMLYKLDLFRQGAAQAINQAEARARDLLNGVELMGVHVASDSRIDFINDYALRVTGWTREEVLGRNWYDTFATPERRESARQTYARVNAGEVTMERQRESPILTRDGRVRIIRWSHVQRHDSSGRLMGVASLGEDITDVRAAAEERRRYEELVTNLVRNSPLAAAVIGLDRRVQLWNPAAAELLGWSEEELLDSPVPGAIFVGPDRWAIARMFAQAARGEAPPHRLVQLASRDGRRLRVRFFVGSLCDPEDRPMAVSVQVEDVTAVVAMEERLREAEHMESIGRLAGGIAHDFNNSLTAIGGFASLIVSSTQDEDTRASAMTILQSSRRAAELTRELLAYSRRSLLKPQVIDVNELLVSIRPVLVSLLDSRASLVVDARLSRALVRVDPGGLERAIVNLVTNARDAMPDGGVATISTELQDGLVAIRVTDTGLGIPLEVQSKVFDPFFTTKPVGSGTGLGLAMVKGFVVQSGGRVRLDSTPGHGTSIEIALPLAPAEAIADETRDAELAGGGSETILLVEDDAAVAAVGFRILALAGYRVMAASSGAAAIALQRSDASPVDLLLLDVMLPDTRGPVLAEALRRFQPEAALLYVSGYSTEELARSGELPREIEVIEKPYEPNELLLRVRRVLDREGEPESR